MPTGRTQGWSWCQFGVSQEQLSNDMYFILIEQAQVCHAPDWRADMKIQVDEIRNGRLELAFGLDLCRERIIQNPKFRYPEKFLQKLSKMIYKIRRKQVTCKSNLSIQQVLFTCLTVRSPSKTTQQASHVKLDRPFRTWVCIIHYPKIVSKSHRGGRPKARWDHQQQRALLIEV